MLVCGCGWGWGLGVGWQLVASSYSKATVYLGLNALRLGQTQLVMQLSVYYCSSGISSE